MASIGCALPAGGGSRAKEGRALRVSVLPASAQWVAQSVKASARAFVYCFNFEFISLTG